MLDIDKNDGVATLRRLKKGGCVLCQRHTKLTFHHLIPRKMHRRNFFKKHADKATLALGINICRQCHVGIHKLYDEMTLAKQFNTYAKLTADPLVAQHVAWVKKQKIMTK
ncbi:MAG: hypothetical protein ABWW63_02950 [Glaciecola sp.]|jgi:5-methylcytosine-specific restriction endonuclease McrA